MRLRHHSLVRCLLLCLPIPSRTARMVSLRDTEMMGSPRRLQAITKVKETVIRMNARTEEKMQHELDRFSSACDNFGLTISTTKTKVMHQTAPGKSYQETCVSVKGHKLQAVDRSTYLGSTLSREVNIDAEVNNRIEKASAAFGRLRKNVWECRGLSKNQAEGLPRCGPHYPPTCL